MLFHGWSSRACVVVLSTLLLVCSACADETDEVNWHSDYREACAAAKEAGQMLLVWFVDPRCAQNSDYFQKSVLEHADVAARLGKMTALKIPSDFKLDIAGKETTLLQHPAF